MSGKTLYTIPGGVPFADALARGILDQTGGTPEILPTYTILLPTRRATRTVREAFLRLSGGKPLLLPRLQPLGDVDDEELSILFAAREENFSLPAAMPPLRRQLLLARLIGGLPEFARGAQPDMALARALGQLMDQVYTEDLNLADLPRLVDTDKFADHWQITVNFLSILSEHWPKILAESGMIDAADRRNRLIKALADHWEEVQPRTPVIAAGTTGSIPATVRLLDVIARLPAGSVVLPGLDAMNDDPESWNKIDDSHPQMALKKLLGVLSIDPQDVQLWPGVKVPPAMAARQALAHEMMRPADTAEAWRTLSHRKPAFKGATDGLLRYDCATPQEESLVIATALRETLEADNKIAALITTDRSLARRVAMNCRRWGIEIDDSAGQPLTDTRVGGYLRLAIQAAAQRLSPVALLAFLKSGLSGPDRYKGDWRGDIRLLDARLRGPAPRAGLSGLKDKLETVPSLKTLIVTIDKAFSPILSLAEPQKSVPFTTFLDAHLALAESLCPPERLWTEEDGEEAARFFADLRDHAGLLPDATLEDYAEILDSLLVCVSVRPAYGRHPRLMILGQLEARLIQADRIIMAGLNEGSWPPAPPADPWMSRPMRKDFGLPDPDRGIGLSAHDFIQGFCGADVILTRSLRVDGAPTVPSRWLSRLDTVLQALEIEPASLSHGPHRHWAAHIDDVDAVKPVTRPAPAPPVGARPRSLSVTKIENWLNDPYSIYARHILRLKPLDPLEKPVDAAIKGSLLHKIMHKFVQNHPKQLPDDAKDRFLTLAIAELNAYADDPALWSFWKPRLSRLGGWVIEHENEWRQRWQFAAGEIRGETLFTGPAGGFTLTAIADRIDLSHDGAEAAVIDYKSGGTYTLSGMKSGRFPQLPLEALILAGGGFESIGARVPGVLAYWVLTGGRDPGKITPLDKDVQHAIDAARDGLQGLIEAFDDEKTPYYSLPDPARAPRFNDYEHLARVREWAALDETEDAA